MTTVTVSPKFQVVIPLAVRQRLKLEPGAKLMVVEFNGGLRLLPLKPPSALRGPWMNMCVSSPELVPFWVTSALIVEPAVAKTT